MNKEQLITKLKQANKAYNANMPIMTDSEYDQLWNQIYQLDPSCPHLYHTSHDPSIPGDLVEHARPIFGTNKAFCVEDLKPFLTRFKDQNLVIEPKYDGCAAVLERTKSGYKLTLEGNGKYGQDVTRHLSKLSMRFKPNVFNSVEIIIPQARWHPDYGKNPRNVMAGWLARPELPEDQTAEIVSHDYGQLFYHLRADKITLDLIMNKDNCLFDLLLDLYTQWKDYYPIDGLMIKVAEQSQRIKLASNGTTNNWSIAWKPPIQSSWTTVLDVEWNVSRAGRIVPTIIYETISLCGTENSRVTGNNYQWLIDKRITIGSKILVGKAGEIIPKVLQVADSPFLVPIPVCCPFCKGVLEKVGRDLICSSDDCLPQTISSLGYFYSDKGMDLKSIGEAVIAQMLENPALQRGFKERKWLLLEPKPHESYALMSVLGDKRYGTYVYERRKISGKKTPVHFITALGYKGLAYRTAYICWTYMKTGKLKGNISKEKLFNFAAAVTEFYEAERQMKEFKFNHQVVNPDVTYCITGTLSSPRESFIEYLATKNWLFTPQVSKHTDVLIIGDSPGKTKLTKAKELSIPLIREDQLSEAIKLNTNKGG